MYLVLLLSCIHGARLLFRLLLLPPSHLKWFADTITTSATNARIILLKFEPHKILRHGRIHATSAAAATSAIDTRTIPDEICSPSRVSET